TPSSPPSRPTSGSISTWSTTPSTPSAPAPAPPPLPTSRRSRATASSSGASAATRASSPPRCGPSSARSTAAAAPRRSSNPTARTDARGALPPEAPPNGVEAPSAPILLFRRALPSAFRPGARRLVEVDRLGVEDPRLGPEVVGDLGAYRRVGGEDHEGVLA